jgi:hypothetical protein
MEPADAVLKGKPHAFESWSGHLSFSIASNFLLTPSDVAPLGGYRFHRNYQTANTCSTFFLDLLVDHSRFRK